MAKHNQISAFMKAITVFEMGGRATKPFWNLVTRPQLFENVLIRHYFKVLSCCREW